MSGGSNASPHSDRARSSDESTSSRPVASALANGGGMIPKPVIIARSMSRMVATPSSSTRHDSTNALSEKRSTSRSVEASAAVLIEPLSGLRAQVAGVHALLHAAMDVEALAVGLLEVLGDVQHRVEAEHVGEEERAHGHGLGLGEHLVELLGGDLFLLLDAPHLRDRGVGDPVADEAGALGAADRHLPDGLGEIGRGLRGLRRG